VEATTLLVQRRRKESLSSASLIDLPARASGMTAQTAKQAALERSKKSRQRAGKDAEQVGAMLQRHKLFASLSRVEISELVQTMEPCIFEKGDLVIEQCAALASDPYLYVVLSGEADMIVHGKFEEQLIQVRAWVWRVQHSGTHQTERRDITKRDTLYKYKHIRSI
jgi:hypothetical protein